MSVDRYRFDLSARDLRGLTKRELEVLTLVLEGRSNKEVAVALFCSKRTVDYHLARIYVKLQVSNRVQAMRRAAMMGLLAAEPVGLPK